MPLSLRLITGSDLTLDRESLTIVRKFQVLGTLPYISGGDAFDYVSSLVMGLIVASYPTYGTPMGTLYWNSIQLHENFYAQSYEISVTYSPHNKQTGTYQITVDQAVRNVKATAGVFVAKYDAPGETIASGKTTFFDGVEMGGEDVPVAMDRISISYRHPQAYLNGAYIRAVGRLRGYPNSDTFLGYAPGEVRYMGGNFTQSDCEASASYNFDISPNVTDLVFGGVTIAQKYGFDSIVPTYKPDVVSNEGVKIVKGVTILRTREWKAYVPVFGWGS